MICAAPATVAGDLPQQSAEMSFFFQAEDGIRDPVVTGVQTCALPILRPPEKVAPGLDREAQHECRLGEDREIGDQAGAAIAHELDRAPMMTIVAVEQRNQRAGINDDAWHGESRSGWPCD